MKRSALAHYPILAFAVLSVASCDCQDIESADLLISDLTSTSHQADANNTVTIDVGETIHFATEIANKRDDAGECDVASAVASVLGSVVQLFVNGNLAGTADTTYATPELALGNNHNQQNGIQFNVPGEYEATQYADFQNSVNEYDEDNNWVVVFEFLEWIIDLFGKDQIQERKFRVVVRDSTPINAEKTAHYEELIATGKFVTFK